MSNEKGRTKGTVVTERPATSQTRLAPKTEKTSKVTIPRQALGTLQKDAKNPKKLVGTNSSQRSPDSVQTKAGKEIERRKRKDKHGGEQKAELVAKTTQTELSMEESIHYRMCTQQDPPVEYWQELAERRRIALAQTLQENEELHGEIERLKAALDKHNTAQEDSKYISFLYKLSTTDDTAPK